MLPNEGQSIVFSVEKRCYLLIPLELPNSLASPRASVKMDEDGDTIINEQLKRGKERRGLEGRRRREEDAKRKQNKKMKIFFPS